MLTLLMIGGWIVSYYRLIFAGNFLVVTCCFWRAQRVPTGRIPSRTPVAGCEGMGCLLTTFCTGCPLS